MIRRFTSPRQRTGEWGEEAAAAFLVKHSFAIVERNVATTRGEIDIIAKKAGTYYFFEVKTGWAGSWFNPGENMTKAKIRKFLSSVAYYCLLHQTKHYQVWALIVRLSKVPGIEASVEMFAIE